MPESHTPEPWFIFRNGHCIGGPHEQGPQDQSAQETAGIATCGVRRRTDEEIEANARRIVACVNACAGIPTEDLEHAARQSLPGARLERLGKAVELARHR